MGCGTSIDSRNKLKILSRWQSIFDTLNLVEVDVLKFWKLFRKIAPLLKPEPFHSIPIRKFLNHLNIHPVIFLFKAFQVFKLDNEPNGIFDNFIEFFLSLWNFCTLDEVALAKFVFFLYDNNRSGKVTSKSLMLLVKDVYGPEFKSNPIAMKIFTKIQASISGRGLNERMFLAYAKMNPQMLYRVLAMQSEFQKKTFGIMAWSHYRNARTTIDSDSLQELFVRLNPLFFSNRIIATKRKNNKPEANHSVSSCVFSSRYSGKFSASMLSASEQSMDNSMKAKRRISRADIRVIMPISTCAFIPALVGRANSEVNLISKSKIVYNSLKKPMGSTRRRSDGQLVRSYASYGKGNIVKQLIFVPMPVSIPMPRLSNEIRVLNNTATGAGAGGGGGGESALSTNESPVNTAVRTKSLLINDGEVKPRRRPSTPHPHIPASLSDIGYSESHHHLMNDNKYDSDFFLSKYLLPKRKENNNNSSSSNSNSNPHPFVIHLGFSSQENQMITNSPMIKPKRRPTGYASTSNSANTSPRRPHHHPSSHNYGFGDKILDSCRLHQRHMSINKIAAVNTSMTNNNNINNNNNVTNTATATVLLSQRDMETPVERNDCRFDS